MSIDLTEVTTDMTPTCLIMAQVGIRTKAYKNDCNGQKPDVSTAKSAAALPQRTRRRAGTHKTIDK